MDNSKDKYLGWFLLAVAFTSLVLVFVLGRSAEVDIELTPTPVADGLPDNLNYGSVERVYDLIRNRFDGPLDREDLITGLKKGLVEATGDQHSEYLDIDQTKAFDEFLSGQFEGVGIEITDREGFLQVVTPIDGSPAFAAGLKPKDIILEIDGQPTGEMTISEAVQLIRGPSGTVVELKIHREDTEPRTFSITRTLIDLPSVSWRVEDGIGIIRISQFDGNATDLLAEAASEIIDQELEGVILDLRSNPGGEVNQALSVAGFWLQEGQVAVEYYVDGQSVETDEVAGAADFLSGQPVFADWSTVVLIDGASASASEIVAGALQDYDRATLVGETSFGKGSVQELIKLGEGPDVETLKLTISHFYTPLGRQIDGVGLTPDIVIVNPEPDDGEEAVDAQLEKAKSLIKQSDGQN